jgi:hypothetical protein
VIERIEELVREIEAAPDPATVERARALVREVLELHRAALERALAIVRDQGGAGAVEALARDERTAALLLLHDLHPHDLEARAREALGRVAGARLISVSGGVVRAAVPNASLRDLAREALAGAAPDAAAIEVEAPPEGFVPIGRLKR